MSEARGEFTLDAYAEILRALLDHGFGCKEYRDAEPDRPHLILRHDLDVSLAHALPMAEVERSLDVSATYFVLMRSEMYNPFAPASEAALRRIRDCGHRIGLHFDASVYPDDIGALESACAAECDLLEAACGATVDMVSFHRPSDRLLAHDQKIAGRAHAYQPAYFREIGYCSDSRGGWHHGHPLDHEFVRSGRALQLLTHPIWWSGDPAAPDVRLNRFLRDRVRHLDEYLAANISVHVAGRISWPGVTGQ